MNTFAQWYDDSQIGFIWIENDLRMVMDEFGDLHVVPFCDWCQQNFDPI